MESEYVYQKPIQIENEGKADMTPINMNIASIGTVNASLGSPRELLKSAILSNAAAVMILHNHPSGNLSPSQADINLTDKMLKAFVMLATFYSFYLCSIIFI